MNKMQKKAPTRLLIGMLIVTMGLIVLDQVVKQFVRSQVPSGESRTVIPHLLSITNITNSGAAWSFLAGNSWLFILIAIGAAAIFLYLMYKEQNNSWIMGCLGLMLAGTIGNLVDRIVYGAVTDFVQLDFMQFPIFNLADCYLTLGVGLILVRLIVKED
ncbi:signal peptidase II [Fructilactobacillus hinvesii]|uniref:Lipoprotein signal peptidase n=1 Tax=Fructilactobacillus hinvesii TaxID=2940300 RepID=A0ABY5BRB6_9LACO|nr:signal peptidase II [Fructilactobacillus hinvesii]USS87510.1 signal peptidase II [Fructilactobacillus hinvesii]